MLACDGRKYRDRHRERAEVHLMELPGSHYVVLLHDPQLRKGLVVVGDRPATRGTPSRSGRRMRVWFARVLHALAAHAEPGVSSVAGTAPVSIPSELAQGEP
jgi:hypothetical protein